MPPPPSSGSAPPDPSRKGGPSGTFPADGGWPPTTGERNRGSLPKKIHPVNPSFERAQKNAHVPTKYQVGNGARNARNRPFSVPTAQLWPGCIPGSGADHPKPERTLPLLYNGAPHTTAHLFFPPSCSLTNCGIFPRWDLGELMYSPRDIARTLKVEGY